MTLVIYVSITSLRYKYKFSVTWLTSSSSSVPLILITCRRTRAISWITSAEEKSCFVYLQKMGPKKRKVVCKILPEHLLTHAQNCLPNWQCFVSFSRAFYNACTWSNIEPVGHYTLQGPYIGTQHTLTVWDRLKVMCSSIVEAYCLIIPNIP